MDNDNETITGIEAIDEQTSSAFVQEGRKCGFAATAEAWQSNPTHYVNDCMHCELFTPECIE